jgi:hypothetical protein
MYIYIYRERERERERESVDDRGSNVSMKCRWNEIDEGELIWKDMEDKTLSVTFCPSVFPVPLKQES